MTQLSMFEAMFVAPEPVPRRVEPYGPVTPASEVQERITLPHPKMAWDTAEICLHQHTDGLWMWSTSCQTFGWGYSYSVGPKWGNFANSRNDALWLAADEIEKRFLSGSKSGNDREKIAAWVERQKQAAM